ncbi:IS1595 family transposase [Plebeiibacterium marinum]|uniref:IS1595 family transposase n=1 Tax=Plebeiibacterium marinum TaxID=2992111 RepID=A0AAE3MHZ5_9BACT|nr:IS1595 family transposase [Plebeiobacterium marinum]MCW3807437.1 IS1595 family transposase [Plebeiobacterium marinum]
MKARTFHKLLLQVDRLNSDQFRRLKESLQSIELSNKVAANIETPFQELSCPHCKSQKKQRWGKRSGLQRYRCKECKRTYNSLTNTPLSRLRKKEQWLEYSSCLVSGISVRKAAMKCNVHRNTSFRWRHRFLANAKSVAPEKLSGIIEADETYFLKSEKGNKKLNRKPRKRGGKASQRGLSKEQVCVLVCRDRQANTIDHIFENFTGNNLKDYLKDKVSSDILFCSDGKSTYKKFIKEKGYRHGCLNLSKGIRIIKDIVHIQNVNAYHSRLKEWLYRFHGVATKYLENYLSWFRELDEFASDIRPEILLLRGKKASLYKVQPFTVT